MPAMRAMYAPASAQTRTALRKGVDVQHRMRRDLASAGAHGPDADRRERVDAREVRGSRPLDPRRQADVRRPRGRGARSGVEAMAWQGVASGPSRRSTYRGSTAAL